VDIASLEVNICDVKVFMLRKEHMNMIVSCVKDFISNLFMNQNPKKRTFVRLVIFIRDKVKV